MRNVALTLFVALASLSHAQKMDPFDFHAANVVLLQAKPVQQELGVTQAQRNKMNVFARAHRAKVSAYQQELQRQKKTLNANKPDPRLLALFNELKRNALSQLTPVQLKRLREISLQQVRLMALNDSTISKRVGMSSTQLAAFRKAYAEGQQRVYTAQRQVATPILKQYQGKTAKTKEEAEKMRKEVAAKLQAATNKARPKILAIVKDTEKRLLAILTPAQEKTFIALQGKRFAPKK